MMSVFLSAAPVSGKFEVGHVAVGQLDNNTRRVFGQATQATLWKSLQPSFVTH